MLPKGSDSLSLPHSFAGSSGESSAPVACDNISMCLYRAPSPRAVLLGLWVCFPSVLESCCGEGGGAKSAWVVWIGLGRSALPHI